MEKKNYARDFNDKVLNEKYEDELYNNRTIKNKIKKLRDDAVFYCVAAVWLFALIFFTKATVLVLVLLLYLNYKLEYLNKKFFYQIGFMVIVSVVFVIFKEIQNVVPNSLYTLHAKMLVTIVPTVFFFIFLIYFIAAVVSVLKYWFFVDPSMVRVSGFFHHYNLGLQRIASDEKLYRLESEVMARRRKAEDAELTGLMEENTEM